MTAVRLCVCEFGTGTLKRNRCARQRLSQQCDEDIFLTLRLVAQCRGERAQRRRFIAKSVKIADCL